MKVRVNIDVILKLARAEQDDHLFACVVMSKRKSLGLTRVELASAERGLTAALVNDDYRTITPAIARSLRWTRARLARGG